jgi:hypothetical protein
LASGAAGAALGAPRLASDWLTAMAFAPMAVSMLAPIAAMTTGGMPSDSVGSSCSWRTFIAT